MISNDPTTRLAFSMHENQGVYAVLIGSGLSRSARIPTGWEITVELIRRAGLAAGVPEQEDWAKWYLDTTGKEPNYSSLLEDLAQTQAERRAIIQGFLEPTEQEVEEGVKIPTPAHKAIAEMVRSGHIRVIITTNFDRLMENALRDVGMEPTVVSSLDGLSGAEPITHSKCYILKIHGDYKDARILNTEGELGSYAPEIDSQLDRILDEFGLIIAGWSGEWDDALRAAFLRAPNRRYPTFWLSRGKLGDRAQQLVTHRKAVTVGITGADSFFEALQLKLHTLVESNQRNPASVDLLVAMAKRFVAKPEFRIQLDDLISAEHSRLREVVSSSVSNQHAEVRDLAKWRKNYELAALPLSHLAAVIGRWGDVTAEAIIITTLREMITDAAKPPDGAFWAVWQKMKFYPTFLVFTAYSIGLARSKKLISLQHAFNQTVLFDERLSYPMGEYFNPSYFEASIGRAAWDDPEGQKRENPLGNHVAEHLLPMWSPSFAGTNNSALLYARHEFYASLFFYSKRTSEEGLRNIPNGRSSQLVLGRLKYDLDSKRVIEHELESAEYKADIVSAELAPSAQFLDLFCECLKKTSWF